ncbi:hypothetical protein [Poriferisphaera sp. WC338]|uniref:hypothetical protein n=1 Tax=Poriferisphaera sp. WC338 TaxID=3425129 RepID=UPI003D81878C
MSRACKRLSSIIALTCLTSPLVAMPLYEIQTIGPTSPTYERIVSGEYHRDSTAKYVAANNHVTGLADRYYDNAGRGYDVWHFNGTTTQIINLTTSGHYYDHPSGGIYRQSTTQTINANGHVIGRSNRYLVTGGSRGYDVWHFNGSTTTNLSLTGAGYQYNHGSGGIYRYSTVYKINNNINPHIIGSNNTFTATGGSTGIAAWLYNSGTSSHTLLGYYGTGYEYFPAYAGGAAYTSNHVRGLNDNGHAVGFTSRFSTIDGVQIGYDAWYYNGSIHTQLGFTGTGYSYLAAPGNIKRDSKAIYINNSNKVAGWSTRFNNTGTNLGQDAWLYDGGSTTNISLTGPDYQYNPAAAPTDTYQYAIVRELNPLSHAFGDQKRFSSAGDERGQDVWRHLSGSTSQISLTGALYENDNLPGEPAIRHAELTAINNTGSAVGTNRIYSNSGLNYGQDAWLFNHGTNNLDVISLTGGTFEYTDASGTKRDGEAKFITNDNLVAGVSKRYNAGGSAYGQSAWLYDPITDSTSELTFSIRDDGLSYTNVQALTTNGIVLGNYQLFDGATLLGVHAFRWDATNGFFDLGNITTNLAAANWENLLYVVGSDPDAEYIIGNSIKSDMLYGNMPYLLTPTIPEPTSLTILSLAPLLFIRRQAL